MIRTQEIKIRKVRPEIGIAKNFKSLESPSNLPNLATAFYITSKVTELADVAFEKVFIVITLQTDSVWRKMDYFLTYRDKLSLLRYTSMQKKLTCRQTLLVLNIRNSLRLTFLSR